MKRTNRQVVITALLTTLLFNSGCVGLAAELEALLAPSTTGNAVYVLNSVLFDILAPLLY